MYEKASITKEIALVELFGGIGAQKKALNKLYEIKEHMLVEIDIDATISHASIHHDLEKVIDESETFEKEFYIQELSKFNWWSNEKPKDVKKLKIEKLKELYHAKNLTNNFVDITSIDVFRLDEFINRNQKQGRSVVLSWSTPCQDFSKAGLQKGFDGNKGNMTLVTHDLLHKLKHKPNILFFENVPDVMQEKFKSGFHKVFNSLESCGYYHHVMKLNSKNYNVPQTRERVFVLSTLGETHYDEPRKRTRTRVLADILESEVDHSKYLSSDQLDKLIDTTNRSGYIRADRFYPKLKKEAYCGTVTTRHRSSAADIYFLEEVDCINSKVNGKQPSFQDRIFSSDALAPTIATSFMYNVTVPIKSGNSVGFESAKENDGIDLNFPGSETRRGRVQKQMSQTLTTSNNLGVIVKNESSYLIRKYTTLEAFRLMTFDDTDHGKAKTFMTESALYKQAGNSIVVDVIYEIFKQLEVRNEL